MSVVVIGLNHRTVAARPARADDHRRRRACPRRCTTSCRREHVSEAVVLSTCNRTEIYVVAERFHGAYADIRNFLSELAFLPPEDFADHLYVHYDDEAVAHLFAVAAGLDSAVRRREPRSSARSARAWERAAGRGHGRRVAQPAVPPRARGRQAGPHRDRHRPPHRLGVAGRGGHGRRAPRRPRAAGASSCSAPARWARAWCAALADAGRRRPPHRQPHVGHARPALADRVGGRAVRLADLNDVARRGRPAAHLHRRHARSCSSTATSSPGRWRAATAGRCSSSTSPCPATSIPPAADLPGVTLLDMDDLRALRRGRHGRAPRARSPCAAHDRRGARALTARVSTAREVAPLVAGAARAGRGDPRAPSSTAIGRALAELDAARSRPSRRSRKGIVAKLLHDPTVALKDAAGHRQGRAPGRGPPRPVRPLDRPAPGRAVVRAATRGSPLARWQTDHVAALLRAADPGSSSVEVGGRRHRRATAARTSPIWEMGGKGVFVKEVQAAVLDGRADLAVHSAKDLPSDTLDGLVLAAVPERADARDALVGSTLAALARGRPDRHRLGPPPGAAGRPPAGPHLRRPARQHRHPARPSRRPRRHRDGGRRARAARRSPSRGRGAATE